MHTDIVTPLQWSSDFFNLVKNTIDNIILLETDSTVFVHEVVTELIPDLIFKKIFTDKCNIFSTSTRITPPPPPPNHTTYNEHKYL